ncbi:unnamed protein product [Caenorhabditis bovis]|uniref:PABS domain-containing protein n=1 Tax=Caenorhabditis bovis TaxID=2654633 RepID=A0A8S1F1T0_9PELO|nr:unnamed protein product [Caenorhabditis bovis]
MVPRIQRFRRTFRILRLLSGSLNVDNGLMSVSMLKTPVDHNQLDTSQWSPEIFALDPQSVNGFFAAQLLKFGILAPIATNVLLIGVASGGLQAYLSQKFEKMNVTGVDIDPLSRIVPHKWFGYVPRGNSRILIENGVEFVRRASRDGPYWHAILLDACHNELKRGTLTCPIMDFLTNSTLEAIQRAIVEDYAILPMNTAFVSGPLMRL